MHALPAASQFERPQQACQATTAHPVRELESRRAQAQHRAAAESLAQHRRTTAAADQCDGSWLCGIIVIPQRRPSPMAMTLRLPHDLAERGRRYAAELGISLNGLLAVALCEDLDARKAGRAAPPPRALAQAITRQVKAGPTPRRR